MSVPDLKKTIFFCIIFLYFSLTMETTERAYTEKPVDFEKVDTSPQE